MENNAPTKSNLIKAKNSLNFSKKGYELLDKKRNVLIREMMCYVERAKDLQRRINSTFAEAYSALSKANITMGISTTSDIAMSIPEANDFEVLFRSVMGVEVPQIKFETQAIKPKYSFYSTNTTMDLAYEKFNEVKSLIYELAEVENSVFRLAMDIKKTQKRANALENIQIPKFKNLVKLISEVLEEKDREDFFRLKILKRKKN